MLFADIQDGKVMIVTITSFNTVQCYSALDSDGFVALEVKYSIACCNLAFAIQYNISYLSYTTIDCKNTYCWLIMLICLI